MTIRPVLAAAFGLAAMLLAPSAQAQDTLRGLQERFQQQFRSAGDGGIPSREAVEALRNRQVKELEEFLGRAQGDDRFNGRMMLADMQAARGRFDEAKTALGALDAEACPAVILLLASDLAGYLAMEDKAAAWRKQALEKDAPFEDRMTIGMLLMTRFQDVAAGEALFADALAAAEDDEGRAKVAWFRAAAMREREDLPEGSYYEELAKVAGAYPDTEYGRIARDRGKAASLQAGDAPLPFELKDTEGKPILLSDYEGKVLLVVFWASWSADSRGLVPWLRELRTRHRDAGLEVLGISLDEDRADMARAIATDKVDWRQAFGGRGMESPVALRLLVETVPHVLLIGKDGKIVAQGVHGLGSRASERQLFEETLEGALGNSGGGERR